MKNIFTESEDIKEQGITKEYEISINGIILNAWITSIDLSEDILYINTVANGELEFHGRWEQKQPIYSDEFKFIFEGYNKGYIRIKEIR